MIYDIIPTNDETWIVCGGRDFADNEMFDNSMGDLIRMRGIPRRIVHGAARRKKVNGEYVYGGADGLADKWAKRHAIDVKPEPADWDTHGKAAGPIRNQKMLDKFNPSLVVAFPGGRGTADMIRRARTGNVDVAEIVPSND